jgi:reactive intermediate/imine deaminase
MEKKIIGKRTAGLPFSPGVLVGDTLYLSGAIGFDPKIKGIVPGGIEAETRKAIENLKELLNQCGMDLKDVVKVTVYLSDINDYTTFNKVYSEYFPSDPPAREACAVSGLAFNARVELSFIAVRSR